jgi:hypothetical protein
MRRAYYRSKFLLESVHLRPERRYPVAGESLMHKPQFVATHMGCGEIDPVLHQTQRLSHRLRAISIANCHFVIR